jgi:hypothetical protein
MSTPTIPKAPRRRKPKKFTRKPPRGYLAALGRLTAVNGDYAHGNNHSPPAKLQEGNQEGGFHTPLPGATP